MSIQVAIRHHTTYSYDRSIKLSPQVIRLRPAPHARMPIRGYSLKVEPSEHFMNWQQDPFGNYLARVVIPERTTSFTIDVEIILDMVTINPFDFFLEEYAEETPFTYSPQLHKELTPYLEIVESGPRLMEWVAKAKALQGQRSVDFLVALNQQLCEAVNYTIRMEPGIQSCEQTLDRALGSCRDSAWLLVQILRHLGLAARFVSGYLVQLKADEKPLEGPSGTVQDFTDLHAWAEVYLPGAGWIGLDATSGLFAGEGHIPLACTPDPASAAPVSGLTEPCEVQFTFRNSVERIWEKPRVTKPYTDTQWQNILQLGEQVDQALQAGDVRLTMGGEPTFVSAEDMDSPQWNDQADGQDKRQAAYALTQKLKHHFGSGGHIHHGQGKWYPGEPLPRWQYAIYWRKDGQPLWHDPQWEAHPMQDQGLTETDGNTFLQKLAYYLGVAPSNTLPAYEDVFYFLWEEGNLPVNIDPLDIDPTDKLERKTLSELLDRGLNRPKGYVLPLRRNAAQGQWESCLWQFSRKHLFLVPGNSSIGLRLPLDRLPYLSPSHREVQMESSPLAHEGNLASHQELTQQVEGRKGDANEPQPKASPNQEGEFRPTFELPTIKTAISAEVKGGNLYLFLPPISPFDSYVDLIFTIEKVATELQIPVIVEGYQPPYDARVEKLVVAPDPGVIEVNIHPATTWTQIVHNYDALFELARDCRLGTEKFMLDGKHTGTGGGNHITLGGKTPADSPFLRRPDLLRSFINFWQNHPGLSYLFSSTFIGPTSQAPRVDEGRKGMLYELEIAFAELDRHPNPTPWLVDRLFRNLLIDVTGNTHRAEFCIDKLYSPDSQSGRLGILEMRGFDMPPHKEMCLSQILLIRALCAAFWQHPYRQPLVRWGTDLHDRFLIHHFVREDLADVCTYLQQQGFHFELGWLDPFFEFRFPILGQVQVGSIDLTIRAGIEPWNVLGEEMSNTGTARFVDSSVERVEVRIEGINQERYYLLCNQVRVPLTPTGKNGSYVASIRYKAWNPPSALHPTIGVDVPLVFDIYDSWNKRSIGGCTYFVSHPGGRNYDTFPINSYEAEARRTNRFWEYNHTPSAVNQLFNPVKGGDQAVRYVTEHQQTQEAFSVISMEVDREFPYTLDMRKVGK